MLFLSLNVHCVGLFFSFCLSYNDLEASCYQLCKRRWSIYGHIVIQSGFNFVLTCVIQITYHGHHYIVPSPWENNGKNCVYECIVSSTIQILNHESSDFSVKRTFNQKVIRICMRKCSQIPYYQKPSILWLNCTAFHI